MLAQGDAEMNMVKSDKGVAMSTIGVDTETPNRKANVKKLTKIAITGEREAIDIEPGET